MTRFRNVVVAVDVSDGDRLVGTEASYLSPAGRGALEKACWVVRRSGGSLHILTSLDVDLRAEALLRRELAAGADSVVRAAERRVEQLAAPLRADGLGVTVEVAFGRASAAVLADVERNGRDLAVVGTRERGAVARNLLGSTSLQLLRRCPVAVWVARSAPRGRINTILVPVDIGDMTAEILATAASLAAAFTAQMVVVHAVDPRLERVLESGGSDAPEIRRIAALRTTEASAALLHAVETVRRDGIDVDTHVAVGDPAELILAEAARVRPDLVVMGSVVHGAARGVFLGSTAEKVLPQLATSLLVVKPRRPAPPRR